ncbi:hypothetical protein [Paenibacillus pabuli]|uniref:hypothetical protein n=1 Tax=Paenibacillus pabuli TaxID=1472 RepID=UPI003CEE34E2
MSIANYVKDAVLHDDFHSEPIGQKPKELLKKRIRIFSIQPKKNGTESLRFGAVFFGWDCQAQQLYGVKNYGGSKGFCS